MLRFFFRKNQRDPALDRRNTTGAMPLLEMASIVHGARGRGKVTFA
jgi:hypothetical protein